MYVPYLFSYVYIKEAIFSTTFFLDFLPGWELFSVHSWMEDRLGMFSWDRPENVIVSKVSLATPFNIGSEWKGSCSSFWVGRNWVWCASYSRGWIIERGQQGSGSQWMSHALPPSPPCILNYTSSTLRKWLNPLNRHTCTCTHKFLCFYHCEDTHWQNALFSPQP